MIVEQRIKNFEKLGLGMFVHFGMYSLFGKGEWHKHSNNVPDEEYFPRFKEFCPEKDWAEKLVQTAKKGGCKYITITTRHHDGFSLYDTKELNDFNSVTSCGRDIIREFVDECNKAGIVPFFYHTLLDWHEESYKTDFKKYLVYLRRSIEILCTNYGKIGGLWFDGMWDKWDEDWEEDELYGTIRKHQPDAMIINNTGLSLRGKTGHKEIDCTTFERGRVNNIDIKEKYLACECCEIFGLHWGYAKNDFAYKGVKDVIEEFVQARKYNANYLLNVGPLPSGYLRPLDKAMYETFGEWVEIYKDALYNVETTSDFTIKGDERDFVLKGEDGAYYMFCHGLTKRGSVNETLENGGRVDNVIITDKKIKEMIWLDNSKDVAFSKTDNGYIATVGLQSYGEAYVVRVAKIVIEN
ncbi:MAG: alpha-L-fucosidase [Clostridiales bacterium]|nr:alpha-L-fucosidase [Clostridiales bacterium]